MKQTAYKKLLESVVSKQDSRPILKCIHYYNGNAYATDSHQLVKINYDKDNKDNKDNYLINTETGLPDYGKFPSVDNLFPTNNQIITTAVIDYSGVASLLVYLKANKKEVLQLKVSDGKITINSKSNMVTTVELKEFTGEDLTITINALYLYNIFNAIASLGKQYSLKDDIKINFLGKNYPVYIQYPTIKFLATPMRTY